jgi:hypothetical protein
VNVLFIFDNGKVPDFGNWEVCNDWRSGVTADRHHKGAIHCTESLSRLSVHLRLRVG